MENVKITTILVGVSEKSGEYEGNPYHNIVIHYTEPFPNEKDIGVSCNVAKIKYANAIDVFGGVLPSADDFKKAIGKPVDFVYNKFGQVVYCRIGK